MTASLDVLLPVGPRPFDPAEPDLVRTAVAEGLVQGLWVRDLPCVPAGDPDVGQGGDPFADLALLVGSGVDRGVATLGTASLILGLRHPLVVARAVIGLQSRTACRVVLGVGTGGKPAMNEALGVADRSMHDFAVRWRQLRDVLHGHGAGAATVVVVPEGYVPPEMHLATSDLRRWEAIQGAAEGWQTFLSSPEHYLRTREEVLAVRGAPLRVCVRADVHVGGTGSAPEVTDRGRVRCTAAQLVPLVRTWLQLPLDHLLLSVRGADPLTTLRTLRAAL